MENARCRVGLRRANLVCATLAAGVVLWSANPWTGEAPYESVDGLLALLAAMAWCVSPYLQLAAASHWQRNLPRVFPWRFVAATVIGLGGTYLYLDAAFIHPDPQSALAFLVVPFYQWCGIVACEALLRFVPWVWQSARQ